ncbi:MAG: SagB family peptide dehydrogenase [Chloroflexi bacterium]|nr:SagB family peptide dehydrogenase [Chloroflexota bacterium]
MAAQARGAWRGYLSSVSRSSTAVLEYHEATKHSPRSVQTNRFELDWANKPLPFKVYTSLEPRPLPMRFNASDAPALEAIAGRVATPRVATDPAREMTVEMLARLCYFANGITRVLQRNGQRIPFRAAACTGALYHIELYLVCGDLADLAAGVYHYGAHDNALRVLRPGDYRGVLRSATGDEPSIASAPAIMLCTSTFWRNAWKYQARAYRHAFWDSGTVVANLLSVAAANHVPAQLVLGFADVPVNELLGLESAREAAVCLVSLGRDVAAAADSPRLEPLRLPTQPLSAAEVAYPQIAAAHAAGSLASGAAAAAWRHAAQPGAAIAETVSSAQAETSGCAWRHAAQPASIERVILRRGSSRRFGQEPIGFDQLLTMLTVATRPIASDVAANLTEPYVIVNAVDRLATGAYVFNRQSASLQLLQPGHFRPQAAFLDLGQDLAGDAAINVYWLADLNVALARLGARGYRAAQLEAAIEGGKLYLAAYALGLGATGLTFFDDEVTRFFVPHAASASVMFLDAVGRPARKVAAG